MKAITVKYYGPTNMRSARLKAFDADGNCCRVSRHADGLDDLGGEALHKAVAVRLCEKMGWPTELLGGGVKDGFVFVFAKQ